VFEQYFNEQKIEQDSYLNIKHLPPGGSNFTKDLDIYGIVKGVSRYRDFFLFKQIETPVTQ